MSKDTPRWFVVFVLLCCTLALVIWARGPVHHHGRYVGSLASLHAATSGTRG